MKNNGSNLSRLKQKEGLLLNKISNYPKILDNASDYWKETLNGLSENIFYCDRDTTLKDAEINNIEENLHKTDQLKNKQINMDCDNSSIIGIYLNNY
jgi:hypothetical protein